VEGRERRAAAWRWALGVGLPVGLAQAVLNQGDLWMRHAVDWTVMVKTLLTPMVSVLVAWVSATAGPRTRKEGER
jgi:signal transduction histidine kinase